MDAKQKKKVEQWVKNLPFFFASCGAKEEVEMAEALVELLKEQETPSLRLFNEREYVVRYTGDALQLLPDTMQELVRCKDCKWRFDLHCPMFDGETDHVPDLNWFCADGERGTDDA